MLELNLKGTETLFFYFYRNIIMTHKLAPNLPL